MKRFLIGMMLAVSASVQAQNISGRVFLAGDRSPAQFAGVGLHQLPDSGVVSGVITLSDGDYTFENVKPGSYFIKVSFVGYGADPENVLLERISHKQHQQYKYAPMNQLPVKDKTKLTIQEHHLLDRLERADKNVKDPAIERIYKLTVEPEVGKSLDDVVAAYNACKEIEYAELNYIVLMSSTIPNDPLFDKQWALHNIGQNYPPNSTGTIDSDIDAPEAWDLSTGSR
nr:carboxypeptidase regulatory-like domain-containing protein [Bacteroidales bacterium]